MLKHIRERIVAGLTSMLDNLLEDDPENSDKYLRLARIKYQLKDFEGAIRDLEMTLKHDLHNASAYYWRSRVKYDADQTASALHDVLRAIEMRPDDSLSFYLLGNIHLRLRNYDAAERAYSTVLRLGNAESAAHAGRGYARYGMERYADSLDDLLAARHSGFDASMLDDYIEDIRLKLKAAG